MKKLIVLFASVALVLSFAVTASAEWNFYGSARMATFWNDNDANAGDDDGTTWAQQGNSRIGASVKGDAVGGKFEYGTGINLRQLYGTWNFGAGTLLVGQTYTPLNLFMSNQVYNGDGGLLNMGGGVYGGRRGMLQVSFGSFAVALIDPSNAAAIGGGDVDVSLPKIEAKFGFKSDMFSLTVAGGYQTWDEVGTAAGDISVDSYVLAGQVDVGLGPAKIKVAAGMSQNSADYGLWLNEDVGAVISGTTLQDEDSYWLGGSVAFKASDMLTLEGGVSYYQHSPDAGGDDDGMAYYVQVAISPAPGVYIIPEVGVIDHGDNTAGNDEGSLTYLGAKWQINF